MPDLREKISKYLFKKTGVNYSKDNILITPGSKEAMLLMHVAFNGEILTPAPSWVSYEPQAQIGLNKVHWMETSQENNWFPTAKELENKLKIIGKKKNLILILNSPNNPSGAICNNLKDLAKVAKKYKLLVLSDEIYTDLSFDGNYKSISKFYPEFTFISGGLSKWCGAGGWRLGFLAVPNGSKEFMNSLILRELLLSKKTHDVSSIMRQVRKILALISKHEFPKDGMPLHVLIYLFDEAFERIPC